MFYKTLTLWRNFSINTKCKFYGNVLYAREYRPTLQKKNTQNTKQVALRLQLKYSSEILTNELVTRTNLGLATG